MSKHGVDLTQFTIPLSRLPRFLASLLSIVFSIFLIAASCGPVKPPPPPSSANVTLDYAFASLGAPQCTGTVNWDIKPVTLTGTSGNSAEINKMGDVGGTPDANHNCHATFSASQLKFGTWQFSVRSALLYACQLTIQSDENISFAEGRELCSHVP